MNITVNGKPKSLTEMLSVQGLLNSLEINAERVAVELNRTILPKDKFAQTNLCDGDTLEIVQFVGGG